MRDREVSVCGVWGRGLWWWGGGVVVAKLEVSKAKIFYSSHIIEKHELLTIHIHKVGGIVFLLPWKQNLPATR